MRQATTLRDGVQWYVDGFSLARGMGRIWFAAVTLLGAITLAIATLLRLKVMIGIFLTPVMLGGLVHLHALLAAQGHATGQALWTRWRPDLKPLAEAAGWLVFALFLTVGLCALIVLAGNHGSMSRDGLSLGIVLGIFFLAGGILLVMAIVLFLAFFFVPAQITLTHMKPLAAIRASFAHSLAHVPALFAFVVLTGLGLSLAGAVSGVLGHLFSHLTGLAPGRLIRFFGLLQMVLLAPIMAAAWLRACQSVLAESDAEPSTTA